MTETLEPKYTWKARLSNVLCPKCGARLKKYIGYRNGRRWTSGHYCPNGDYRKPPAGERLGGA